MLVLTRREGERIKIGNDIEVTLIQIRGNQVRLGIAAPAGVVIIRSELVGTTPKNPRKNNAA